MNQGDVYWYTFRAPDKRRPVLILTRNSAIAFLTGVTVAPLTSTIRGIPSEVLLTPAEDGVSADCAVNLDNIQTVQKAGLGARLTHLSLERMREVRAAVEFALGFDAQT
ncbi:MAG TPA: type II toxin-antitoxin system PemK/MazF family toxin [Pyrinomonadaceae bacterium]|jgi:mRNA interferase MazF|nr:type II toxin-antitoxin system PemK/MazF family toxin [Pyrinomonadaceae bacterium]